MSADIVRCLVGGGKLTAERDEPGHRIIPGPALAAYARETHRTERPVFLPLVALPVRFHAELPRLHPLLQS
ncbi:hypothetical protein ACFPH6_48040 [Streptomyces xiangluensis]|uniref:Uncharacterized protein n=1 Tax=Streptomyces xiangluensis TaxID=2665720 RepID=A0ABV8Z6I1_9ACTN